MEENDSIIYELPVYLNTSLSNELHVAQYPLQPKNRERSKPCQARFKSGQQMLELDYEIDQTSEYYDQQGVEEYLKQKVQVLSSSKIPSLTNYAIGVYRGNQLHLCPVKSVLQMRPSFKHIDKTMVDDLHEFIVDDEEVEEKKTDETQVKQIQMQVKRRESDRAEARRRSSYATKKAEEDAESWVELQVHSKEDPSGEDEFEDLFTESDQAVEFDISADEYVKLLHYQGEEQTDTKMQDDFQAINPLYRKIIDIVQTASVISFDDICNRFPEMNAEDLLSILGEYAALIQGRFVLKSQPSMLHTAVLWMLYSNPKGISRETITTTLEAPEEDVKKILQTFGRLDPIQRVWTLKLKPDIFFINEYPKFVKAQTKYWNSIKSTLKSQFCAL